jgi:riboflavin synthase
VSGHVDGIGTVSAARNVGDAVEVTIEAPADLRAYLAPKGSVTVDGVSLTINRNTGSGFSVMLIPHTRSVTTLGELDRGRAVNLEIDLLARYVVHYLRARSAADTDSTLLDALSRAGYVKE